jgi:uncharacterized protein
MAKKLIDIKAVNWQLSNIRLGDVSEGIDDLRQCIQTILTTTKGSDPMRPLFGSDIWRFIDTPVTTAVANISAEIIDSVSKWESRVNVEKLVYDVTGSRMDFSLTAKMLESGETTEILFYVDRQSQIAPDVLGRSFSNGFDFGFS